MDADPEIFEDSTLDEILEDVPSGRLSDYGPPPPWPYEETSLVRTVRSAWKKNFGNLTGRELRTLMSQGMGIEHLGETAVRLIAKFPSADYGNYPGELALAALQQSDDFKKFAPGFRTWVHSDLSGLESELAWSRPLAREFGDLLALACSK